MQNISHDVGCGWGVAATWARELAFLGNSVHVNVSAKFTQFSIKNSNWLH